MVILGSKHCIYNYTDIIIIITEFYVVNSQMICNIMIILGSKHCIYDYINTIITELYVVNSNMICNIMVILGSKHCIYDYINTIITELYVVNSKMIQNVYTEMLQIFAWYKVMRFAKLCAAVFFNRKISIFILYSN